MWPEIPVCKIVFLLVLAVGHGTADTQGLRGLAGTNASDRDRGLRCKSVCSKQGLEGLRVWAVLLARLKGEVKSEATGLLPPNGSISTFRANADGFFFFCGGTLAYRGQGT